MNCSICKSKFAPTELTPGYGVDENGEKVCYSCCGEQDKKTLKSLEIGEQWYLYLVKNETGWRLTNWPGTLSIPVRTPKKGRHNFAKVRYDVWFSYSGNNYWGVTYGHNTQICHIKRIG